MADATWAISSFLGGEISQFAQGRFDKPDYRISLNVCFNAFPGEIGPWMRRPGTRYGGHTRGGAKGRVIKFDYQSAAPITCEFTDGYVRFRQGTSLVLSSAPVAVVAVSIANPAVVQFAAAVNWATGDTGVFPGASTPLLENRQFLLTKIDTTHFSLADALTGATIDGSTLGALVAGATMGKVHERVTPYIGGAWANVRAVQAETTDVLLCPSVPPQALVATTLPAPGVSPGFTLSPATFNDGPYLDPFTNGVQATPGALSGIVGITLAFPAWNPVLAYAKGSFVTSGGVNYESLVDQNEGSAAEISTSNSSASIVGTNTFSAGNPVEFFVSGGALNSALTAGTIYYVIATGLSSAHFQVSATLGGSAISMTGAGTGAQTVALAPAGLTGAWEVVSASAAINGGKGFLGTDISRLVRLFSEPPLWDINSIYAASTATEPVTVAYNPSGEPGEATYWQSLTSNNTGNAPGTDLTNWQIIPQGAAIWTWGKIVSLTNIISPSLSGSLDIGNMTVGGGLAAAFDGAFAKSAATSANSATTTGSQGSIGSATLVTLASFVGKNYSGASNQQIQQVTVYPSSDQGFFKLTYVEELFAPSTVTTTFNLRGKSTAPASSSDGTLLGTSGPLSNAFAAATIVSSDQATAWPYSWVEQVTVLTIPAGAVLLFYSLTNYVAQLSFFNPPGAGTSSGVNVEILGPPLLYTNPVLTWRIGSWSNTTGYPTCGCYDDGRLWTGGVSSNHFDTSTSNGIVPGSSVINFAPTDQYGVVSADSAISETLNSDSSNPIFSMIPDLQGILMGTQVAEFLVLAPTSGSIAPNNITSRRGTAIGSENIEPVRTDHTILFVKRYGRKLIEYFADVFSGKFSGPNLADKFEHIVRAGIAEIRYTDATTPIAWGRCNDGSWFGVTYKRDALTTSQGPTNAAAHRHALGSGRLVESICSGPSVDGELDALTMVTNDPTTNIRHVEVLTDTMDELTALAEAWFLDDAVNPTSIISTAAGGAYGYGQLTVNGLWHLNGKTVQVFAAGIDCGDPGEGKPPSDFVVANGSVTIPYGDGISAGPGRGLLTATFIAGIPLTQIVVGFTYNSDGQMVRPIAPADTGARNGPALGKIRRTHRYSALLSNTLGISFGTSFTKLQPVAFKLADDTTKIPPLTAYSGVIQAQPFDDYSYNSMLCWRVSRPFPGIVVAVSGNIQTQDQ